ncbi:MAG TPA: SHOCT domain-containing protein [Candidatus Nitrosotalea sp.]|nr:SHOCT domain-containing protein [Candidatus Nitrosotalea sp.]
MFMDYNGGMMSGYNDGGNWLWMATMMVVVLGVIIGLVVFAIRASAPKTNDQALSILRQRLAGGEITHDEFEKTRKTLQG